MRTLTLDEKITLKGKLARHGVLAAHLAVLDTASAVWFWGRCAGTSIARYAQWPA